MGYYTVKKLLQAKVSLTTWETPRRYAFRRRPIWLVVGFIFGEASEEPTYANTILAESRAEFWGSNKGRETCEKFELVVGQIRRVLSTTFARVQT